MKIFRTRIDEDNIDFEQDDADLDEVEDGFDQIIGSEAETVSSILVWMTMRTKNSTMRPWHQSNNAAIYRQQLVMEGMAADVGRHAWEEYLLDLPSLCISPAD